MSVALEGVGAIEPSQNLVEVEGLVKWFPVRAGIFKTVVGWIKAVDDVSFTIRRGETLGLVGESGCGKTTTARAVLRLIEPTSGRISFDGMDLMRLGPRELARMRPQMQVIFQDPYGSLNPRHTVMEIVGEALAYHGMVKRGKALEERVAELLDMVGLSPQQMRRYPHEFSGGQRQRIGIARALATSPKLIVCDEPVSALDVSIQSQILNLLEDLQAKFGVTYLFIAHGLHVVKHISNRVGVMYLGKLIEVAGSEEIYAEPLHPYTQALISAIPIPDPRRRRQRMILQGDVPSPLNPPPGCRFWTRCPVMTDACREAQPVLRDVGRGHQVACLRYE
ncbi:MAG: ABC transporter ATP-binding protein [Firmicutes bacterium]|nr:ABC transporter ATP-binding protein [Bacillota bacterium]MDH7495468.1 ABC transporter ATP-binding protein [Bacillota bacterium]